MPRKVDNVYYFPKYLVFGMVFIFNENFNGVLKILNFKVMPLPS